jgi:hypothetical protein
VVFVSAPVYILLYSITCVSEARPSIRSCSMGFVDLIKGYVLQRHRKNLRLSRPDR